MNSHPPSRTTSPSEGAGDLARLLDTEARLDATLQRAKEQAAVLVATARAAADAREAALSADLEALGRTLATSIADERGRQEKELADTAHTEARRYDEASAEQVEALARYVVERVIGTEP